MYYKYTVKLKDIFEVLRPQEWVKNLFVFAPLIFGGSFVEPVTAMRTVAASLLFCFLASGVYIFNDIADRKRDIAHPEKRQRPIASGRVPIKLAWFMCLTLPLIALVVAWFLNPELALILGSYFLINLAYSLGLKQIVILDAICISSGFILRILAGGTVTGVFVSHWLLVCTLTLSLFIIFSKRNEELHSLGENPTDFYQRPSLRGYSLSFLDHATTAFGTLTMMCYLLYAADPETAKFYGTRNVFITTPFVFYGISYYLNLIHTHNRGGNPCALLFRDRHLQLTCFCWIFTWVGIIFYKHIR